MVKYTIDETKRVVVAEMTGCEMDVHHRLKKRINGLMDITSVSSKSIISKSYRATAKCHPDDTFDPEVGKAIAKNRLLNKYNEACIKACKRVEDEIHRLQVGAYDVLDSQMNHMLKNFKKYN